MKPTSKTIPASLDTKSDANMKSSLGDDPYCNEEKHRDLAICDDRQTRIAVSAYYRAAARGFAPGHELEDWLWAEKETDFTDWQSAEKRLSDIAG